MNIQEKIKDWIKETLEIEEDFVLAHPKDLKNGDYSFFVPKACGEGGYFEDIVKILSGNKIPEIERIEAVGNFINFYLSKDFLLNLLKKLLKG